MEQILKWYATSDWLPSGPHFIIGLTNYPIPKLGWVEEYGQAGEDSYLFITHSLEAPYKKHKILILQKHKYEGQEEDYNKRGVEYIKYWTYFGFPAFPSFEVLFEMNIKIGDQANIQLIPRWRNEDD